MKVTLTLLQTTFKQIINESKHRSGAFLIPYFLMLLIEGLPMMYVEMAIGQYFRGGSIVSWEKIHPSLKGVGTYQHPCS